VKYQEEVRHRENAESSAASAEGKASMSQEELNCCGSEGDLWVKCLEGAIMQY
ncbi:hypothetical protein MKX03_005565, partial [Papaver bracteatum]